MLTCPVCSHNYDSNQHLPKILPSCGHTICLECLSTILTPQQPQECPECKNSFPSNTEKEHFQTNIALQQVLEMMNNICKKHNAPKNQVCLVDYQNICVNCANDDHKNHQTRSLQDTKMQTKKKIQEMSEKEKTFNEKAKNEIQQILQKSHDNMNGLIENGIAKLKDDFERKKRWFSWDVEALFALKRRKSIATDPQIIRFKEEDEAYSQKLGSNIIDKEYLEILEKDISQVPNIHKEQLQEFSTKIEQVKINMKTGETEEIFQEENFVNDIMMGEITPQERLRINLEIAQKCYFEIYVGDGLLVITPQESFQSFLEFEQSITPEETSNISKICLYQEKTKFTDEMVQALNIIWKNLTNTTEVKLNYSHESFDGDKDLIQCAKFPFWKETQSLITTLHLNFKDCLLDQTPFAKFISQNLVKLQNLKELFLFYERTIHIDDTIINALTDQVLPFLKNLDILHLWLDNTKVTDASIINLSFQLNKLKQLTLSLINTKVSDNTLSTLSNVTFKNSPDLEEFHLYLPGTQITTSGIQILFKNFSKLTRLRTLSLFLEETLISETAIPDFSHDFCKYAVDLQSLRLSFNSCKLSEHSLEILFCNFPKQLSNLEFGIQDGSMTDKTIKILVTESLRNMPNLAQLELCISHAVFTQEGLMSLFSYLHNNAIISKLNLIFYSTSLDDDSVCYFIENVVPTMSSLNSCHFDASGCHLQNSTLDKISNLNKMYEEEEN